MKAWYRRAKLALIWLLADLIDIAWLSPTAECGRCRKAPVKMPDKIQERFGTLSPS